MGSWRDSRDTAPVMMFNAKGRSAFLLLGDHAGNAIPDTLGTMGLSPEHRVRHIAWDIGVAAVGTLMAQALDAVFLHQHYSRLVIDCNRDSSSPEAIPEQSDGTIIPANIGLTQADRASRIAAIHTPYHAAIAAEIARRQAIAMPTVLLALHSFTPEMAGVVRPWHAGILHSGGDTRFARALLDELQRDTSLIVGDNQPYQMDDTDYTVPRHAFAAAIPYAEIEIRQDLISDQAGQHAWSEKLIAACTAALPAVL